MRRRLATVRSRLRGALPPAGSPATGPQDAGPAPHEVDEKPEMDFLERDRLDIEHVGRLVSWVLAADDNCIDVGAHRGSVLEQIVRLAPQGMHIAYEPLPHLHADLVKRFPQVDVRNAALSDHPGRSAFVHVRAAEGWSGLKFRPLPENAEGDVQEISVRLEVLDEVLPGDYIPRLIKIDVEGAEQQVIRGAIRTLVEHRPLVIFEHGLGSANAYGTEPDDIHRLLCDVAGLRIFDLDGRGPYSVEDLRRVYYAAERVNFVAHP